MSLTIVLWEKHFCSEQIMLVTPTQVTTCSSWWWQIYSFQAAFTNDLWVAEAGIRPFGYNPRSYTSHHKQQLVGGNQKNFRQPLVMTCELPRQETDHSVTTHAPTQVTTAAADRGNLTNFRQLLVITCELPRQETDHLVTTHAPTQVTTCSSW